MLLQTPQRARLRWLGWPLACALLLGLGNVARSQVPLPSHPLAACKILDQEAANYIKAPQPAAAANIPDNDGFPGIGVIGEDPDCPFHRAAIRMFLWLTSRQDTSSGGNDSYVFNSKLFNDVLAADSSGQHRIVQVPSGTLPTRSLTAAMPQSGPGGKPTEFDDTGRMYTVVRPVQVKTAAFLPMRIEAFSVVNEGRRIEVRTGRHKFFIDIDPKAASVGRPQLLDANGNEIRLSGEIISVKKMPVPLDTSDNAVVFGPGQAGKHVLMTADRKLVYYSVRVNDVFKWFLAKYSRTTPRPTRFPSSLAEVDRSLPDAKALIVEVKTSWIDVCGGLAYDKCADERTKYRGKYLTLDARIPTYKPSSSNDSVLLEGPEKKTTLALLGMHVVFSAKGFAGMLWSTFEHVGNARNAGYSYYDDSHIAQTLRQPHDGAGDWLLAGSTDSCSSAKVDNANAPRLKMDGRNIKATTPSGIGPSEICRRSPWGTYEPSGFPFERSNAATISINRSVASAFEDHARTDVRKNYVLIGTTWMDTEEMPSPDNFDQKGTKSLANATMETFRQQKRSNCLTCHRDGALNAPLLNVSHIWRQLHREAARRPTR